MSSAALVVTDAELVTSGAGTVTHDDTTVTITPRAEFVGDLVVTYEIVDEDGLTDSADMLLTVQPIPIGRRWPVTTRTAVVNGGTVVVPIALNDRIPTATS